MKLFKKIITGVLVLLIIVSIAAIIYIALFKFEEKERKAPPVADKKQTEVRKIIPPPEKKQTHKETPPAVAGKTPAKQEKIVVAKIEKIPVAQRQVAIIIDDIGHDLGKVRELLKINADITFAILPLLNNSREAAQLLHSAGRETILHLPMEPSSYPKEKPGSGALFTDMNERELLYQLEKDLASVPGVSGVNNHMGSKFMEDKDKLVLIFNKLKKRKMFFIDSRTTANTKANAAASEVGLPIAARKVFLDNNRNYEEIYKILMDVAERSAAGNSIPVIIIGHPYPETIRAIKDAQKVFREKGIEVVPVSKVLNARSAKGAS